MNRLAAILVFTLGLLSCNTQNKSTEASAEEIWPITVDMTSAEHIDTPIKLSQIATNIEYISLSEEPLIDDIAYSPIRIFDDTLYLDGDNIFKYTPDGKFIKNYFLRGLVQQKPKNIELSQRLLTQKTGMSHLKML